MDKYEPLSCDYYELFEVACLHGYELRIEMLGGQQFKGIAKDLVIHDDRSEWLLLEAPGFVGQVRLDHINVVDALSDGAQFSQMNIAKNNIG